MMLAAVAIFNIGELPRRFSADPAALGLSGISGTPRDLWRQTDLAPSSTLEIPSHGAALLLFR